LILHKHPYPAFLPDGLTRLIVGTIPPPRFSLGQLFEEDVNFCYGSKYGLLWPILDRIFELGLLYENTAEAIKQRKHFLSEHKIGICDIVESCERAKLDASDIGMKQIEMRDLVSLLREHKSIVTLLLMGGNSMNGPEYLLKKQLKLKGISLITDLVSVKSHRLELEGRDVRVYTLISPSSAANRSVGNLAEYKMMKSENEHYTVFDYRLQQYKKFFL
jgi:G:T/U-mismatch repair DNA glycosylase